MKQILLRKGNAVTSEVPVPKIERNDILVRTSVSCLSIGTELSSLKGSGIPLWKRAAKQPEKIVRVLESLANEGLSKTLNVLKEKNDIVTPTGYSLSGVVVGVGEDVKDLCLGDRVACSGGQYAYHAEYIRVSRNLCTVIPKTVDFESASTVTLGAIALQGVRRASPTLGETFTVIGLGILGQLTVQLLKANGCKCIGVDPDKSRIQMAYDLGLDYGFSAEGADAEAIARLTDGYGADGVIITAASSSDDIVSQAFQFCRKKGRVVLVGDVGLNLNRDDFYEKEIDFYISCSYGPGRYDKKYEDSGLDYPLGYVRWTENRNMAEYLRLIESESIEVRSMISSRYDVSQATEAYASLEDSPKPLVVLLTYSDTKNETEAVRKVELSDNANSSDCQISIGVIGAGNFALSSHLPNIKKSKENFSLRVVVNRTGHSAKFAGDRFDADYVSTEPEEAMSDPKIDALVIATRHHLHGTLTLDALKAGKHVLVEKPLTLSTEELSKIEALFSADNNTPILLTGYNRRFSIFAKRLKSLVAKRSSPFVLNYRMNAGYISQDHWVHGEEGGGRNLGEACHIYDLFTFLTEAEVDTISAHSIKPQGGQYRRNDNFVASFGFSDGSVCSLTYTSMGNEEYPKEHAELHVDGKVAVLNDYKELSVHGDSKLSYRSRFQDKGLLDELDSFGEGIRTGNWPIPLWQQIQVCKIGFEVERMITT